MEIAIFSLTAVLGTFLQLSLVPVPFWLFVLLVWYLRNGLRDIYLLILLPCLLLSVLSQTPVFLNLLTASLALGVFVVGKRLLPPRMVFVVLLLIFSGLTWEFLFSLGMLL